LGVSVVEKRVLGDNVDDVASALRELLSKADVVVVTGGLGPTADDVTREAVAAALGRTTYHSNELEGWIRQRYAELDRAMPDVCLRMALGVEGTRPLRNTRGTAPGLMAEIDNSLLAVLPGVPWEMELMLERDLLPELEKRCGRSGRAQRTLLLGGVVESATEQRIKHLYDRFGRENVTILASFGVIRLVFTAEGDEVVTKQRLDEMELAFRKLLGSDVAAVDRAGLQHAVVDELGSRGQTMATAESCTGGLIGAAITDVSGSSQVYLGGVVSYSNHAKEEMLGVPRQMLIDHGAVSEPVARAMARGVREKFQSDWAVGITGIAGPTGGTEEKPVGTVHWAVAGPTVEEHRVVRFPGSREVVREWSVNAALDLVRRCVQEGKS
jgi:nicotinamide-nucleotide amidase